MQDLMDWAFKAMTSGALTCAVYILWGLKNSVESLNVKVAVIIDRVEHHEKRLDRLEEHK